MKTWIAGLSMLLLAGCAAMSAKKAELAVWESYELIQIEIERVVTKPDCPTVLKIRLKAIDRKAVAALRAYSAGVQTYKQVTETIQILISDFITLKGKEEYHVNFRNATFDS